MIWALNVAPLQIQKCVYGKYRPQQTEYSLWKLLTSAGIFHIQNEQGEEEPEITKCFVLRALMWDLEIYYSVFWAEQS